MDGNLKDFTGLMDNIVIAEVEDRDNVDYFVCYDDLVIWDYIGGNPNIYVSLYNRNKDGGHGYCLMFVDNHGDRYFRGSFRNMGEVSTWIEEPWEL